MRLPLTAAGRRCLAVFARRCDGAVAVEFAFVSVPFVILLLAIMEMALSFFVSEILDTATMSAGRLIRTGQAYDAGMTQAQFKAEICSAMMDLVDCDANLYVDVQAYSTFSSYSPTSPLDEDGNLATAKFTSGDTTQPIIVVRSFYQWPIYFNLLAYTGYVINGHVLLGAVAAFRVEPFS